MSCVRAAFTILHIFIRLIIGVGADQNNGNIAGHRNRTRGGAGQGEVFGRLVRMGGHGNIIMGRDTRIGAAANIGLGIVLHHQRIEGHTNTDRAAAANAADHINRVDRIIRPDGHILTGLREAGRLVDAALDEGAGVGLMDFDAGRHANTNRSANTAGNHRGNRIFIRIGFDISVTTGIGHGIVIYIGLSSVLDIADPEGSTNAGRAAAADATGNLDQVSRRIRCDFEVAVSLDRTVNIGFGCVDQHTDRRRACDPGGIAEPQRGGGINDFVLVAGLHQNILCGLHRGTGADIGQCVFDLNDDVAANPDPGGACTGPQRRGQIGPIGVGNGPDNHIRACAVIIGRHRRAIGNRGLGGVDTDTGRQGNGNGIVRRHRT